LTSFLLLWSKVLPKWSSFQCHIQLSSAPHLTHKLWTNLEKRWRGKTLLLFAITSVTKYKKSYNIGSMTQQKW